MLRSVIANALFLKGTGCLETGQPARALRYLGFASRLASDNAGFAGAAALAAHKSGDAEAAVRHGERALQVDPTLDWVRDLLGAVFLNGEFYFDALARIHRHLQPRTYLEIGIAQGESLRSVQPHTRVIGVDPAAELPYEPPINVRIFRQTSDEFFAQHDARKEFGGLPLELAFIDGMHHFDYALRDFMNVERCCEPSSTILIHDCFPRDRVTAQRERASAFWSGDVWKLVVLLKKYRPELAIHTVATPPTGLTIVRNLDPSSTVIAANLARLCEEFLALDYSYVEKDRAAKLNLVPNDWARVQPLLGRS